MNGPSRFVVLDHVHSSYLLLATLAGLGLAAGVLYRIGLIGWVLRGLGLVVRGGIRGGFLLWERLLAWASWPLFLALVFGFLVVGGVAGGPLPGVRVVCGLAPLFMGAIACLAYMFIDLERYEVERGHKAVHNPLKGQELAMHLARYGQQVGVPLLVAATVAMIGGFALLNQGLYETIGRDWYQVADEPGEPVYVDFLAYALTNLLGIVDVLDLAQLAPAGCGPRTSARPRGRPPPCWPGSRRSSPWCCCNRSSPPSARGSCWPRRSPTSGARTSRSTSGRGTRCRSTGPGPSGRCWCRCARSRR